MAARFDLQGLVLASTAIAVLGLSTAPASAQQNASGASTSELPPVVVTSPETRRATTAPSRPARRTATSGMSRRNQRAAATAAASRNAARNVADVKPGQNPRGPINGYVATRAMTGTKTDTPIMETPQAISVIGRDEIRDQKPNSFAAALRYAPGVAPRPSALTPVTTGSRSAVSTRRTSDCLSTAFNYSALHLPPGNSRPRGIERIDILRGPSSVLYGGGSPGGFVNIISKTPPLTPQN